jgi:GNAT superfamily N-acetyltransferase
MRFEIRTATLDDVQAMHSVRNSVRENRLSNPANVTPASYRPFVLAGSAWVAETDSGVVGFAALDPGTQSIWALFVEPGSEGSGIGRALHSRMTSWACERGLERLSLRTEVGSRAESFYRLAGWTQIGLSPDGEAIFQKWLGGTPAAQTSPE